jgi:hypothetical protein
VGTKEQFSYVIIGAVPDGSSRVRVEMFTGTAEARIRELHEDVDVPDLNDADGITAAVDERCRKFAADVAGLPLPGEAPPVPDALAGLVGQTRTVEPVEA